MGRRRSPFDIALYQLYAVALGNTNIWPTMFGRCTWQMYVIVPGLFATNDTVWICPLTSSKVSTPSNGALGGRVFFRPTVNMMAPSNYL